VHTFFTLASVRCRPLAVCCDCTATAPPLFSSTSLQAATATRSRSLLAVRVRTAVILLRLMRRLPEPAPALAGAPLVPLAGASCALLGAAAAPWVAVAALGFTQSWTDAHVRSTCAHSVSTSSVNQGTTSGTSIRVEEQDPLGVDLLPLSVGWLAQMPNAGCPAERAPRESDTVLVRDVLVLPRSVARATL
jgi:hypothetical protein